MCKSSNIWYFKSMKIEINNNIRSGCYFPTKHLMVDSNVISKL